MTKERELGLKSWLIGPGRKGDRAEDKPETRVSLDRHRLAVLPFVNMSPQADDEYFADGTTEEMISTLSNIRELTVISRTSTMQYKGVKKSLADISRELKAGTLLEGSVRKAGNRVRITVQLLDALEDRHLWSRTYDRELQDIFAVQSDIARSVAEVVKVELLASAIGRLQERPTGSNEAYLLYLRGRQEGNKRSEDGARRAIEYFTEALARDPKFALAHVGLADSYFVLGWRGAMTPTEATEKAKPAVLRALQLDDGLAEAHTCYAQVYEHGWNWDAAEGEYRKAIELNPNYATAHQWYSFLLAEEGRFEIALAETEKALQLDPLSAVINSNVSHRLLMIERWDEAEEYAKRALQIQPNLVSALFCITLAYLGKGDYDGAVARWEKFAQVVPSKARAIVFLATIQAWLGRRDEARRNIESASKLPDFKTVAPTLVAWAFAALHDEDKVFEWLGKALEQQDPMVTGINDNLVFRDLRSRPRYREILKKMGLDKYSLSI